MANELNDIKADIVAAKAKIVKVATDVANLHAKIDLITGELPTAEEWAEVKALTVELNSNLQAIDDVTLDDIVPPPVG